MEALSSSETSVLTRATWRNTPEDSILHSYRRENLKSYLINRMFPAVKQTEINVHGQPFRWPRYKLYPLNLAQGSRKSGGRTIGIVRLRNKSHGVCCLFSRMLSDDCEVISLTGWPVYEIMLPSSLSNGFQDNLYSCMLDTSVYLQQFHLLAAIYSLMHTWFI
jgi:hypothetical protein